MSPQSDSPIQGPAFSGVGGRTAEPPSGSFQASAADWEAAWKVFAAERESMASVIRSMLATGVSRDDADDLLHTFALTHLPGVARVTAGFEADERGRYLRASLRNFVRSTIRTQARQKRAIQLLINEWSREQSPFTEAAPDLPEVSLDDLSHRSALSLFLGLHGTSASIREIARQCGTSRYVARQAVLDALISAALELGETGALTPAEVNACRHVMLLGHSVVQAAEDLNVPPHRVRNAIARARRVVSSALLRS